MHTSQTRFLNVLVHHHGDFDDVIAAHNHMTPLERLSLSMNNKRTYIQRIDNINVISEILRTTMWYSNMPISMTPAQKPCNSLRIWFLHAMIPIHFDNGLSVVVLTGITIARSRDGTFKGGKIFIGLFAACHVVCVCIQRIVLS